MATLVPANDTAKWAATDQRVESLSGEFHSFRSEVRGTLSDIQKQLSQPTNWGWVIAAVSLVGLVLTYAVRPGDVERAQINRTLQNLVVELDGRQKWMQEFTAETRANAASVTARLDENKHDIADLQEAMIRQMAMDIESVKNRAELDVLVQSNKEALSTLDAMLQREMRLLDGRQSEQIANLDERLQREMVDKLEPLRLQVNRLLGDVEHITRTRFSKQDAQVLIGNGKGGG